MLTTRNPAKKLRTTGSPELEDFITKNASAIACSIFQFLDLPELSTTARVSKAFESTVVVHNKKINCDTLALAETEVGVLHKDYKNLRRGEVTATLSLYFFMISTPRNLLIYLANLSSLKHFL